MMNDEEFWRLVSLISGSLWDDQTSDLSALEDALAAMPRADIEAFYVTLANKAYALSTRQHYTAFSSFPGLADSFLYARLAVIANGRETYDAILKNPLEFPARSTEAWFENLLYVCDSAYFRSTGMDFGRPQSELFESVQD